MRIVVAEDDPVSRRAIEHLLRGWGYETVSTADGAQAWKILQGQDAPRMALLDWVMPGLDGLALCRMVREHPRDRYVYVVLLTAKGEKQDLIRGLEAGADDYLAKPFDPHELNVRLRAGRRIIELQDQLLAARRAVERVASHDALTGVWNRSELAGILHREMAHSRRTAVPLALAMADLDHFKAVNDRYGHLAGDAVLREVAGRLRRSLRAYDTVVRYGGEVFLLVMPGCDDARAWVVAERARDSVQRRPVETPDGLLSVTVSIGVATTAHAGAVGQEALIRAVDAALYRAKRSGRNRVELAAATDFPDPWLVTVGRARPS